MFNLFNKKEDFLAPISGELIAIEKVNDPVFAQKMMGDGFGIIPCDSMVYAPMSGTVTVCFPTNHAVGIESDDGKEYLIHIGINTVELQGKGFTPHVVQGQKIKQGDPLIAIDLEEIKKLGYDSTVLVIFPNRTIELKEELKAIKDHQAIAIKFCK